MSLRPRRLRLVSEQSYLYEEEIDASYIRRVLIRMTQTIPYKQHISSEIRRDFHLAKTRLS